MVTGATTSHGPFNKHLSTIGVTDSPKGDHAWRGKTRTASLTGLSTADRLGHGIPVGWMEKVEPFFSSPDETVSCENKAALPYHMFPILIMCRNQKFGQTIPLDSYDSNQTPKRLANRKLHR